MSFTNFVVDQGADFSTELTLTEDDGSVVNVATYIFVGQLRKSYYSANASANLVINVSANVVGNVALTMNAAVTANLAAGKYVYDVFMTNDNSVKSRLLNGIITVAPRVTR